MNDIDRVARELIQGQQEAMSVLFGALATLGNAEELTAAIKKHLDAFVAAGTISEIGKAIAIGGLAGADGVRRSQLAG